MNGPFLHETCRNVVRACISPRLKNINIDKNSILFNLFIRIIRSLLALIFVPILVCAFAIQAAATTFMASDSVEPEAGILRKLLADVKIFSIIPQPDCSISLNPTSATWPPQGGFMRSFQVIASDSGCTWSASTPNSWISLVPPTSGTGNGTVFYAVQGFNSPIGRQGVINVNDQVFSVFQNGVGCGYPLSQTSFNFPHNGGTGSISVMAAAGCTWTSTTNDQWITITSGTSGDGTGSVQFSVAADSGPPRTGAVTVTGSIPPGNHPQNVSIIQEGCTYGFAPSSTTMGPAGGKSSFSVSADAGCQWSPVSINPWITITSGPGNGNGTVSFSVASNVGAQRTGTISVADQTFTITQSNGCTFGISTISQNFPSSGGLGSFGVAASDGTCNWSAVSNSSWIAVTGGSPGNGNGTVNFSVQSNNAAARMGSITAAGQMFTITQDSGCAYSLSSVSTNVPSSAGSSSFNITAGSGCTWTATSNSSWINITSGPGSGNGTVSFDVQANTGGGRSGTIAVAGQTFTVNQAPLCSFSLSLPGTNFPASGGSGSFNVTAFDGCQWNATSNSSWITINSGSGNGNGTVTYTVQPNVQPARSGTITAGGQTFTIDQASGCSFTLSSTNVYISSSGGTNQFTVNTGGGCPWTALANEPWIVITSGSSGTGSGNVTFSVQANTSIARVGTITADGQTFTIHQLGTTTVRSLLDFDGDLKTDVAIFRPSNGQWWWFRSSDSVVNAAQFGSSTDKVVAADYTGDGKTDIAFFRPSTGQWFILRSEDGSFYAFPFGTNGDIPMPADYDGDGKADAAVFRPSSATWFILRSSDGQVTFTQFGANGDLPVASDYDGDGKADVAIYRPNGANGAEWWVQRSTAGLLALQFGSSTDKAVPGDYTGDGKTDIAFFRPSTGQWYILRSEDFSYFAFPWGQAGDIPAPGDYDGDGTFDPAVFRPSNSTWYVSRSTAGPLFVGFGIATDQPVPNAYVR